MSAPVRTQRGVVTLMGTLFILITITLLLVVLQRMSASQLLDTALQNDSVEALFLAESGIERASFHFANGTACGALAGIGDTTSRGSFTVNTAVLQAGGDCRIEVKGQASSTTAAGAALRTASADLRLGQPGQVWAVGKNGELFFWDGAAWSKPASPTTQKLKAVTCPTIGECWAAGEKGVILHYVSGVWSQTVLNNKEKYEDIACAPNNPNYCFVVGKDKGGVIRFWNGLSWSAPTTTTDDLKAVTCPSTTCYAVGKKKQPPLQYNGSAWVTDGNNNVNEELKGVHCYSPTGCWAVGKRDKGNFRFARRPGAPPNTWEQVLLNSGLKEAPDLDAVYCTSANNCWATGKKTKSKPDTFTLVHWDGVSWTTWPTGSLGKGEDLKDISCASASDCFAVGKKGSVLHWNGSAWTDASSNVIGKTDLEGVGYLGGSSGGTVTLVRWREVFSN